MRRPRHALALPPGRRFVLRHRSHALQEHGRAGCTACRCFRDLRESWLRWFHAIHKVVWTSNRPYGVGSTRTVRMTRNTAEALLSLGAGSPLLILSDRPFHAALPCVCGGLPPGGGCAAQDAVHLQRGGRAPLDAQVGLSYHTNILRFDVQERLQMSAKLRPESGGLLNRVSFPPGQRWPDAI